MTKSTYNLDAQIGFVLRRASQRHIAIFSELLPDLTTTQFAALFKLYELGPLSQNHLGRVTAMDAATIKGVVDRLRREDLVKSTPDAEDRRRLTVELTDHGRTTVARAIPLAQKITATTIAPLTADEQQTLLALLGKLA